MDTPDPKKELKCPSCENRYVDRIARGAIVKLLLPDNIKRYKCQRCYTKFYSRATRESFA